MTDLFDITSEPSGKLPIAAVFGTDEHLTMSSREIADLCEKRHPDVRRDIRAMMEALGEDVSKSAHTYLDGSGRQQEEYLLPKDMTLTLVAGYNVRLRKRIIDRWLELEGDRLARPMLDFADPRVMLGVFEHLRGQVAERDAVIAIQAPKAEAFDSLMNADGLYGLQNAGRALSARPNKFVDWLKEAHLFYQGSALVPRVQFIQRGIFVVRTTIVDDVARPTTYVSPKGLEYLRHVVPTRVLIGRAA